MIDMFKHFRENCRQRSQQRDNRDNILSVISEQLCTKFYVTAVLNFWKKSAKFVRSVADVVVLVSVQPC